MKLPKIMWSLDKIENERYDSLSAKEKQIAEDAWLTYVASQLIDNGIRTKNDVHEVTVSHNGTVTFWNGVSSETIFTSVAWSYFDMETHKPSIDRTRKVLANEYGTMWISVGGSHRQYDSVIETAKRLGLTWKSGGASSLGSKKHTFIIPSEDLMLWLDHVPSVTVDRSYQKMLKSKNS